MLICASKYSIRIIIIFMIGGNGRILTPLSGRPFRSVVATALDQTTKLDLRNELAPSY